MQEIVVDKCECPFEVAAIIDIVDLIPGATYNYQLNLTNAGSAVFNPASGKFTAKSTTETLNLIIYLKDNPNNHYLISLELVGSHPTNIQYDIVAKQLRRQIICIKNMSCSVPQCTATPTTTPTPSSYRIDKYRTVSNYAVKSNEDKIYGLYRSDITIGDWVDFLNSVAQYDDTYSLWKPQMATDVDCGIQKTYDGFFYVYTVNGCDVGESQCYPNEPTHLSRKISYVSWNDLARYVNWISNGKPKGRQGPDTTEDGSYPLLGNFYNKPIDYYPGSRFWLETGPVPTPTTTPTITPTPSITQSPFPVGLSITSQPATDVFTAVGISQTINVTALAVPSSITLLYQWQNSTNGGASWADISGAVNSSYTITNPQLSDNGVFYRVRISGVPASGGQTPSPINSNNTVLSVTTTQITITNEPDNITTSSTTASFSVTANISPSYGTLSYQWQKSTNSGLDYSNISGATSSTLSLSTISAADSGSMYRVIVSGNGGAVSQTSSSATLIVTAPTIVISSNPQDVTSSDGKAALSVSASIPEATSGSYTLTYTWQRSTDGVNFSNLGSGSSSTSSTLQLDNLTRASNNDKYRVIITSSTSASPVTSSFATLSVDDPYGGAFVWGANSNDQLNFTGSASYPIFTRDNTSLYREISLGQNHGLFINASGTLLAYGSNTQGQTAGNNTNNVVKAVTKYNHNLAIVNTTNGNKLYSWGNNSSGQCGLGSNTAIINSITEISDSNTYKDIAVGENHSLAIRTNNVLVACGNNTHGQLGTGNTTNQNSFVTIMTDMASVSCGQNHSAAIDMSGTLYTWGQNTEGQLGNGNNASVSTPTDIPGVNWKKVVCGANFTVAIKNDGTLWIWGSNSSGQLGDAGSNSRNSPYQITGIWSDISAGNAHVIAIKSDGTLWAWGQNIQGQLGNNSTTSSNVPIQIAQNLLITPIPVDPVWEKVFAGGNSSSAIRQGSIITITSNPQTTESSFPGSASFSISANATNYAPISYQWLFSPTGFSWSPITGANSSTLSLTSLDPTYDNGRYCCVVSAGYNAFPMVSASATLLQKSAAVYYQGIRAAGASTIPMTITAWTQNTELSYGSSLIGNNKTIQIVAIDRYHTAALLSDGRVIVSSSTPFGNRTISNPTGETIVKLIGNPGAPASSSSTLTYLFGISSSGKIYGISNNSAYGTINVWNRIGVSVNLLASDAAGWGQNSLGYNPTLYIIATDGTLWAWGDIRFTTYSFSVPTTGGTQTFGTIPNRVSSESWLAIAGNAGGFFGIKSDNSLWRLVGNWTGGSVFGTGGSSDIIFTSGYLPFGGGNTQQSLQSINPQLINNTIPFNKLVANSSLIVAADISNRIYSSPFITTDRGLPSGWQSIRKITLGSGGAQAGHGAVLLGNTINSNTLNAAVIGVGSDFREYGSNAAWRNSITWPFGSIYPTGVRAQFQDAVPEMSQNYYLVLKDD